MTLDKPRLRFYLCLALVVFCSSLVRLFHYPGPMAFDEQKWLLAAQSLIGMDVMAIQPVYHSRPLWSVLLACWATLFGWTWLAFVYLVFILSVCTTIAVTFAGRSFFGDRAGILSGLFFAFHPINIAYDTAVIPDTLSVLLVAIAVAYFGLFLSFYNTKYLLIVGFLAGLLYAVKNYYILYAVCFGLTVLFFRSRPAKYREFATLTVAGLIGLGLSYLIIRSVVDFESLSRAHSQYLDYIKVDSTETGLRKAYHMLLPQVQYITDLLSDYGQAFGVFTIWTIGVLVSEFRKPKSAFLLFTVMFFLIFLMLTPASVNPFYFLQPHTRYLTVLLVPLSVGAGYALDRLAIGLEAMRLLVPGFLVFIATLGFGAWQANDNWDRYQMMELAGIHTAMDYARKLNINTIAVPESYVLGVPDSLRIEGKEIEFVPIHNNAESDVINFLKDNPTQRAAFIPREHYRELVKDVRFGNTCGSEVNPNLTKTVAALEKAGAERLEITVAYQSFGARLKDVGIFTRGQLVGWLYRLPGKSPMPHSN